MAHTNSFVKINTDNLRHNYNIIKNLSEGKRIISIIKADSYGHGSVECMKVLSSLGCDFFAVANICEALAIREHNKTADILILGFIDEEDIARAVKNNFSLCVYTVEFALAVAGICAENGSKAKLHIKINTGMNRLGFTPKNIKKHAETLAGLANVEFTGVFSHFSTADEEDLTYTKMQYENFLTALGYLRDEGITPEFIHIQNSAGILISDKIDFSETTAVRPGIILYGLDPSGVLSGFGLRPVMSFYAKVANTFILDENSSVSYGRRYTSTEKIRVAVVTAGYADGYHRALSGKADVLINGHRCRILGSVCMDMMMVDVTAYDDIRVGDTVQLFGEDISADELACLAGTINYELLCAVSKRVERIYV